MARRGPEGIGGLQLLGHRYYGSDTGVFLSRDPALDGSNWFGYVEGQPASRVDPSGLQARAQYEREFNNPHWRPIPRRPKGYDLAGQIGKAERLRQKY